MEKARVRAETILYKRSDLEIIDFINTLKESFEDVWIISIEDIKQGYSSKFFAYEYKVRFYHNTYINI